MKILILSENRYTTASGVEKYNRYLCELFHNLNHEISSYSLNLNWEREDVYPIFNYVKEYNADLNKTNNPFLKKKYIDSHISKIIEISKNYDLVINTLNNIMWPKKIPNINNWLYIQHFTPGFYEQKFLINPLFGKLMNGLMYIGGVKNPFKIFNNFVTFSENDKKELKIKNNKKTFFAPLAVYTIEEIENFKKNIDYDKKKQDFVYLGRINNHQKNICYIQTKFKNKDISYYGNDNISLIKNQNQYKGLYNSDNLSKILEPYKYGLMLSKYEGFPYVLIEMLSHGIPCIIKMDSFAASNLFEISKLFTINSESELDSKINKILSIDSKEYKEISNECFDFAIKNLSIDKFLDNWKIIVYFFENQKF